MNPRQQLLEYQTLVTALTKMIADVEMDELPVQLDHVSGPREAMAVTLEIAKQCMASIEQHVADLEAE